MISFRNIINLHLLMTAINVFMILMTNVVECNLNHAKDVNIRNDRRKYLDDEFI